MVFHIAFHPKPANNITLEVPSAKSKEWVFYEIECDEDKDVKVTVFKKLEKKFQDKFWNFLSDDEKSVITDDATLDEYLSTAPFTILVKEFDEWEGQEGW